MPVPTEPSDCCQTLRVRIAIYTHVTVYIHEWYTYICVQNGRAVRCRRLVVRV